MKEMDPPKDENHEEFVLEKLDTLSQASTAVESSQHLEPTVEIIVSPPPQVTPSTSEMAYVNPMYQDCVLDDTFDDPAIVAPPPRDPVVLYVSNPLAGQPTEDAANSDFTHSRLSQKVESIPNAIPVTSTLVRMKNRLGFYLYLYIIWDVVYTKVEKCIPFHVCSIFLHVTMLVMGFVYLNNCYVQRLIPVYLVEAGIFGLIMNAIHIYIYVYKRTQEGVPHYLYIATARAMQFVMLLCFLVGAVLVYEIYPPETLNRDDMRYCNYHLFYFAFAVVNATLAVVLAFVTLFLGLIMFYYC